MVMSAMTAPSPASEVAVVVTIVLDLCMRLILTGRENHCLRWTRKREKEEEVC